MHFSQKKGVYITTLGCPKNLADSNYLKKKLMEEGVSIVYNPDRADIFIVNTCGFIEDARRESIEEILQITAIKKKRAVIITMGCLVQRYRRELSRNLPEVDAFFGIGEEEKIVQYIKRLYPSNEIILNPVKQPPAVTSEPVEDSYSPSSYTYIKISDGCNRRCSFCVIPKIKGPYRSIEPERILMEAEELISHGYKELILVGQETSSYGIDRKGFPSLTELLKEITAINGDFWVRLLYFHPASINDKLIEQIGSNPKICKYIDIPLQHSEDRILRLMKRPGSKEFYKNLIKKLRQIPGLAIRTTFIVGFPGETDKDFYNLKEFIKEMEFERVGVFKYSKEEGTFASKLKKQIPEKIKQKRFDELMTLQAGISLKKNLQMVGKKATCLIDEVENDNLRAFGRLQSHAPEIDGIVIINPKNMDNKGGYTLSIQKSNLKSSTFKDVIITKAYDYDLEAEIVNS